MKKMRTLIGVLCAALLVFGIVTSSSADYLVVPVDADWYYEQVLGGSDDPKDSDYNPYLDKNPDAAAISLLVEYDGTCAFCTFYKQDVGASKDEGSYAKSYVTAFNSDLSGGTITYNAPPPINVVNPVYLLVKDGNHIPRWYLFDISDWNGTDTISMSGFWTGADGGSISHVGLYGPDCPQVPEPGTLLLLGLGLVGLAGLRRKL